MFLVLFFVYFLSLHPWDICVFWWFIYIIFIFAPWDMHYMCVFRGFFFFFIFCSSLHPSNPFQPADTHYKPPAACFGHLWPQPTCFNHLPSPAMCSLAIQAPKRMYKQSYVRFFFCLFLFGFGNACTSSHTCISDVFIYFILFYSTWDTCMIACTCISHILFIENVWITTKILAGMFK